MERVSVYIDGYNLYYGLRRIKAIDYDWQRFYWIDFVKLFDHFKLDKQVLQKVYYFTSPPLRVQKSNRQSLLLNANKLINGSRFQVIKGKFYETEYICPDCGYVNLVPEEKRTDVNISIQMISDCSQDKTDTLILVSADSDLVPPLEMIRRDYPNKKIRVFFPPKGFSNDLNNFMNRKIVSLQKHKIKFTNSIMPDVVTKDSKSYTIPPKWKIV